MEKADQKERCCTHRIEKRRYNLSLRFIFGLMELSNNRAKQLKLFVISTICRQTGLIQRSTVPKSNLTKGIYSFKLLADKMIIVIDKI